MLEKTFELLLANGKLDNEWIKSQLNRLNRFDGEIDTLLNRISNIRTWTFITNRQQWIDNFEHWQNEAKTIEDKLSDELHNRLTQRFVDKRIVILNKTLKEHSNLEAVISIDGKIIVEGEEVGLLKGFEFVPSLSQGEKAGLILSAARKILPKEIERRVRELLMSDNAAFKFDGDCSILWQNNEVAKLTNGETLYAPKIAIIKSEFLSDEQIKQIETRINEAVQKNIENILSESIHLKNPILNVEQQENESKKQQNKLVTTSDNEKKRSESISGKALGIAYQVYEGLGSAQTNSLSMSTINLSESDKRNLARLGLRLGVETIYLPNLLKPAAIKLRAFLWSIYNQDFPKDAFPPDGRVSIKILPNVKREFYRALGFVPLGNLALRADIAERLSALIRIEARTGQFRINDAMLSIAGTTKIQMEEIIYNLGYSKCGEEQSTLSDQLPIVIFERKKKVGKPKVKNFNKKTMKTKNYKDKKLSIKQNKEKLPDPLSPFAVLKSIKIKE